MWAQFERNEYIDIKNDYLHVYMHWTVCGTWFSLSNFSLFFKNYFIVSIQQFSWEWAFLLLRQISQDIFVGKQLITLKSSIMWKWKTRCIALLNFHLYFTATKALTVSSVELSIWNEIWKNEWQNDSFIFKNITFKKFLVDNWKKFGYWIFANCFLNILTTFASIFVPLCFR